MDQTRRSVLLPDDRVRFLDPATGLPRDAPLPRRLDPASLEVAQAAREDIGANPGQSMVSHALDGEIQRLYNITQQSDAARCMKGTFIALNLISIIQKMVRQTTGMQDYRIPEKLFLVTAAGTRHTRGHHNLAPRGGRAVWQYHSSTHITGSGRLGSPEISIWILNVTFSGALHYRLEVHFEMRLEDLSREYFSSHRAPGELIRELGEDSQIAGTQNLRTPLSSAFISLDRVRGSTWGSEVEAGSRRGLRGVEDVRGTSAVDFAWASLPVPLSCLLPLSRGPISDSRAMSSQTHHYIFESLLPAGVRLMEERYGHAANSTGSKAIWRSLVDKGVSDLIGNFLRQGMHDLYAQHPNYHLIEYDIFNYHISTNWPLVTGRHSDGRYDVYVPTISLPVKRILQGDYALDLRSEDFATSSSKGSCAAPAPLDILGSGGTPALERFRSGHFSSTGRTNAIDSDVMIDWLFFPTDPSGHWKVVWEFEQLRSIHPAGSQHHIPNIAVWKLDFELHARLEIGAV
ncbi:hypothetical protein JCM11251_005585 [Rhodosporidiobolus azoricus]